MENGNTKGLLEQIISLPPEWHGSGSFSPVILRAIDKHCAGIDINHSVETGVGKSTLLLSHLSNDHKVFAIDGENSLTMTRESSLLNKETVEFIEGPTQKTIPAYDFTNKLQFALIDGPHGYPFAELEYFYIYPQLEEGALFVIDDVHIPTVNNMFRFMKQDAMYYLLDVVQKTAFFMRTDAETFYPYGDGWEEQGYNRATRWVDHSPSGILKKIIPSTLHKPLRDYLYRAGLWK